MLLLIYRSCQVKDASNFAGSFSLAAFNLQPNTVTQLKVLVHATSLYSAPLINITFMMLIFYNH